MPPDTRTDLKPGDSGFELPRRERVPKGLESNDAFQEYRSLPREKRERLKTEGLEVPDVQRLAAKDAQISALQEVVETHVELVADHQRRLSAFADGYQHITSALLAVAQEGANPEQALRDIAGVVLRASGAPIAPKVAEH